MRTKWESSAGNTLYTTKIFDAWDAESGAKRNGALNLFPPETKAGRGSAGHYASTRASSELAAWVPGACKKKKSRFGCRMYPIIIRIRIRIRIRFS
jgi:hypothetical protein